jgi:hypothetical protein
MRKQLIEKMDQLLEYVDGINDERDSVPILIAVRACWQELKSDLELFRE